VYVRATDSEGEGDGASCVVALDDAAALCPTVSFVDWLYADVGRLQKSRNRVHLWRGAPIASIARSHSFGLGNSWVGLSGVARVHGRAGIARKIHGMSCDCSESHVAAFTARAHFVGNDIGQVPR
jgi:hypothetical protein